MGASSPFLRRGLAAILVLVPGLAATTLAAAGPARAAAVSTGWVTLPANDQEDCLSVGLAAVQAVGFRGTISGDRQTVFGWRGDESLTVWCIGSYGLAVIFAYVQDRNGDSGPLVERIAAAYRQRAADRQRATTATPGAGKR